MVGEPGMGKSRLVHEFTRHQLRPGWLVLEGASVSYGKATPYFPLIEMLRHYFQIVDGEGSENIRDQVVMHIFELDNMLKDAIPPILSLLGALPDEKITPPSDGHNRLIRLQDIGETIKHFISMDPQQRRRHTLDAVKRVLIRESQRQPLLVVFEDLHWVDNETQAFLDSLMDSLPMAHILVLVNYRPGYVHTWNDKTYYTQLRVDPLQPTSAEELLQHLLGSNKDLVPLKELLIHRTEGNPFFAEESVRSLVETGVLVGEKRAYRPGLKIDEIRIPSTVQNVVADRIDRLPIEEKHLLQTAAVIGVIVPLRLLRAVAELSEDELHRYLAHLQAAEFLYETNLFPELEYTFKHALTNEVAYGALLHDRRTALHSQILCVLEETTGDNVQEVVETLAHHAFQKRLEHGARDRPHQAVYGGGHHPGPSQRRHGRRRRADVRPPALRRRVPGGQVVRGTSARRRVVGGLGRSPWDAQRPRASREHRRYSGRRRPGCPYADDSGHAPEGSQAVRRRQARRHAVRPLGPGGNDRRPQRARLRPRPQLRHQPAVAGQPDRGEVQHRPGPGRADQQRREVQGTDGGRLT